MAQIETFDWVHPSWRDVVIDHLMRYPDDRRRFLRRCSMVGLELALSVSGGATGQRDQPLLRTNDDWLEMRHRMLELLPHQGQIGHRLLLEAVHASLLASQDGPLQPSVEETAHELCVALVEEWDRRGEPLGVRVLESFYGLSVQLSRLPGGPQVRRSVDVWLGQLQRNQADPQDAVAGLAVVAENEPRALRQAGWPEQHDEQIATLVTRANQTLADAEEMREELTDVDPPTVDDAEYQSYEAFRWRQILGDLRRAGGDTDESRTALARLVSVESELREWSEEKQREAEEQAAQLTDPWDTDEEDYDTSDPDAFDIEAVLSDL